MTQSSTSTIEKEKIIDKLQEPGMYKVLFINDDVTPMNFVVEVLITIFKHSQAKAEKITQEIHNSGSGIAGIYVYEIAEQKGVEATVLSRENGYPLNIKVEPV
jgi:ATP-dependent Clp protease adaptor protein ClpS